MTLRTLNYGNYGIFLIMGNAGFCPSTLPLVLQGVVLGAFQRPTFEASDRNTDLPSDRVPTEATIPEGPYTLPMELGTKKKPSLLWFWGPNSIMVVYVGPSGNGFGSNV